MHAHGENTNEGKKTSDGEHGTTLCERSKFNCTVYIDPRITLGKPGEVSRRRERERGKGREREKGEKPDEKNGKYTISSHTVQNTNRQDASTKTANANTQKKSALENTTRIQRYSHEVVVVHLNCAR